MLRLGVGERGISEILAVAEHIASLCAGAEAFQLPVDFPDPIEPPGPYAVSPVDPMELEGDSAAAMAEIASWARASLGVDHVPLIWRVLGRMHKMLANTWRKDRLVMSAGRIDENAKACIAFAVAAARQSPYMTAYTTAQLRKVLALDDEGMVEMVASVMHYVSFNTISHGMLLQPARTELRATDFTTE